MSVVISNNEGTTFEAIRQILIHEMLLAEDRVNIFNQRFKIPTDEHLFVYIDCLPSRVISNRSKYALDPVSGDYQEIQDLSSYDPVVIGMFSKNLEALQRKEEVVMALSSHYAQQQQEIHGFKIFRNAPIQDLSQLEGAALLYRYDIPVVLFTWRQKITTVDFFDAFKARVKVSNGEVVTEDFDQPLSSSCSSSSSS